MDRAIPLKARRERAIDRRSLKDDGGKFSNTSQFVRTSAPTRSGWWATDQLAERTARVVAEEDHVAQVELVQEGRDAAGVGERAPVGGLGERMPVRAEGPGGREHPVAVSHEQWRHVVPQVTGGEVAVNADDRPSGAPVLVVDAGVRELDVCHADPPLTDRVLVSYIQSVWKASDAPKPNAQPPPEPR